MSKCKVVELDKTYEDGLNDAWAAARKIRNLDLDILRDIFAYADIDSVFVSYSPQQAIAKLREWEENKEIKRGDEVTGHVKIGIVIASADDINPLIVWDDKSVSFENQKILTKTGRNYADKLDALLAEIGGE